MTRSHVLLALLLATWFAGANAAIAEEPQPDSKSADTATEEIQEVVSRYVAAFNAHDAKAVAKLWRAEGVFHDEQSGEDISGREAIEADLAAMFAEHADVAIGASIDAVRKIRPDVYQISGTAITSRGDEEPVESKYNAILVRNDKTWTFDSITESLVPPAAKPYDQLKVLEPLVGEWQDDSEVVSVRTSVRWTPNRAFLLRSYMLEREDGTTLQGTQVIGWDPLQERIRCWMFDSEGSFGEGTWTQNDAGWTLQFSQTLADGRAAGGTQIITQLDDDTLSVQSIGEEIDGDAAPAREAVRVVRVSDVTEIP